MRYIPLYFESEGITTSPMTEEHQANKSLVMASPLPAQKGRYESARHGRSSNPDLIRNFNIYFLPGPTPIQPLEKRAVCVATQGQEITRWFPGAALQLEGTDPFSVSLIAARNTSSRPFSFT